MRKERVQFGFNVLSALLLAVLSLLPVAAIPPAVRADTASTGGFPDFEHIVIDDNPPATYRITDIQIGDISGDGLPDIWTAGRGEGANADQMVWYKNPDWTRYEISPGDYVYGNLGDFDGDGDLDVVAGQFDDDRIYWFENTGDPEQGDWPKSYLGVSPWADVVLVGDIDKDSRLDVVYLYKDEWGWARNPSDPKNTWSDYAIWSGGTRTGGVLADIDEDGDLDLVYGNAWFENPLPGGDPTRGSQWDMRSIDSAWTTEARSAVGDLNGDGRPDVVLTGEEDESGVAWYIGPSDPHTGDWTKHVVVSSGYDGVHSVDLADFDRDGDLDIFAAEMHHGQDPDKVTVFENVEASANTWNEHTFDTIGSHNAKAGDLDLDGWPDIVGKNYQAGDLPLQVDLWWNLGLGTLPVDQWERHIIDDARPWRAVLIDGGDVNGDGLPDIVTGGWWYENPGSPGGSWTRHDIGGELYNMAVLHDLDGDGDLDILGTDGQPGGDVFQWAENDGSASFTFYTNVPRADGDFLQGARAAQIVPEGNPEVVLSWHSASSTQMYSIPAPATADWSLDVLSSTTNGEQIAVGDIDDDGDLDIHLGTQWLENDGGTWRTRAAFDLGDSVAEPDRVELADIDQDGDLDVVIGAEHSEWVVWGEAPANPQDPWTEHLIANNILGMSMDVADLDWDGDVDVVVGEHDPNNGDVGRVMIYQNQNNGANWNEFQIDSGLEHHDGTQFVDIDNDGDLDIISIGWQHAKTVLYENKASSGGPGNVPPRAVADTYWLDKGGILAVEAPGVLENDSDADGDPLTAGQVSWPAHGTLDLNTDGSFTYEHDGSDAVEDAFTYEANDGQGGTDTAIVSLMVRGAGAIDVRVSESTDDAEERLSDGDMARSGVDLELGEDSTPQLVGLRFQNVDIPPGANIIRAMVEFTADETHSGDTDLTICGQAADDPPTFSPADYDISNRPKTSTCVDWNNVAPWTTIHDTYQSSDLSSIVQEIVNRPGWAGGNSLVLTISGSGQRTAESYNGEPTMAPILHVEYGPQGPCYTLSTGVDPAGSGTISADPQPNCEGTKYAEGTQVQLTANPNAGFTFANWTGDLSGSTNPDTITMDADKTVTAHFSAIPCYALSTSVDPAEGGSVDANPGPNCGAGSYTEGTVVQLTANANAGFTFANWTGALSGSTSPDTVTMDADKTVTAHFGAIPCYTLSTSVDPAESGSVEANPGPNCGAGSYTEGTVVQLTANPSAGFTFANWTGALSGSTNPDTVTMDADKTVTAHFEEFTGATIDVAVNQDSDDAEEKVSTGAVTDGSWDLDLTDSSGEQTIGLRFQNLTIPQGATITEAHLTFHANEVGSKDTDLAFHGQAADNGQTFTETDGDISSRTKTAESVAWDNVPPWTVRSAPYDTPNLAPIIQEIVNRPGWDSGSSLAIIITGTGKRAAKSYDGYPDMAPELHVTYGGQQTCYTLSTGVDPAGSGTISADPQPNCEGTKYAEGTQVQLTANPNAGFTFANWTGDLSGSTNPDTITMDADKTVTAHFSAIPCYALSTSVDPAEGGSVEANPGPNCGAGSYTEGTVVQLTANANAGFTFANWTGALSGSTSPDTVTMDADKTVTAHFGAIPCYTLSTSVDPAESGSVEANPGPNCGAGSYTEGTAVQLTANPSAGFTFANWTGALSGSTNPDTVTMDADKTVTAHFEEFTGATIDVAVNQDSDDAEEKVSTGAVTDGSWDLDLTDSSGEQTIGLRFQNLTIPQGATITEAHLTFHANEVGSKDTDLAFHGQAADNGQTFTETDGDISSRTKTAESVAWDNVPPWTVRSAPYDTPNLAPIIQEIVNRPGWDSGSSLAIIITGTGKRAAKSYDGYPDMAPELHVTYGGQQTCYTLSTEVDPAGSGTISADPQPNCEGTKYAEGTQVQLTANPNAGFTFANWTGDLSGSTNPDTITMDADKTVTAHFSAIPCYALSTSVDPAEGGSVDANPGPNCGAGSYTEGTVVQLTANANAGFTFANWTGALSGSTNPDTVTMDADKTVTAHFGAIPCYTLSTSVDPAESGSVEANPGPNCGAGSYTEGTVVQLTANPSAGFTFANWTGALSGSTNPDTVTMDADKTVTAHFVTSDVGPVVYASNTVDDDQQDDSDGNGDGIADCGETIELYVELRNQGGDAATGVNATLSTDDAYISWVNSPASSYPDLPGGGTATNDDDFDFTIDPNTPTGHAIQFDLEISAASGGPWSDSFDLSVTCGGGGGESIDVAVGDSDDDAEERVRTGSMILGGHDLELVEDTTMQAVGLRFQNVQIPQGATVTDAYLVFHADETHSGDTDLTFHGQAADNAPVFSDAEGDISGRATTAASAAWNDVPAWTTVHDSYQSTDLSPIIQEIVNRPGWSAGNSLVIIITGSGRRVAESFDGEPAMAPMLHIGY